MSNYEQTTTDEHAENETPFQKTGRKKSRPRTNKSRSKKKL